MGVKTLNEEEGSLYSALLGNASFHELLLGYDRDLAETTRARGCGCGGVLHSAQYPRKPRPWALVRSLGPEHHRRFSFCCAVDGCRGRATPPSVRFLGRKVYLAATVVLISIMCLGMSVSRMRRLTGIFDIDRHTIVRWRDWWRKAFTTTPFWRSARAAFMPPVKEDALPAMLLERFAGSATKRMIALLRFLSPLSGG